MVLFPISANNEEDYKVIEAVKKLHKVFRGEAIVNNKGCGIGNKNWNAAKTLKKIIENSDYKYILEE